MNLFDQMEKSGQQRPEETAPRQAEPIEVRLGEAEDEKRVRNWAISHGRKAASKHAASTDDPTEFERLVWSGLRPFTFQPDDAAGFHRIFTEGFAAGWKETGSQAESASESTRTSAANAEPVEAAAAEGTVEESAEADEDESAEEAEEPEPASPRAVTSSTAMTPKIRVLDERDEPYAFDQCTVTITLQLLPVDGSPEGREVIIGVSTHLDAPLLDFTRLTLLGQLPEPVASLLRQVEERMPKMVRFHEEQRAKEKAAAPKRTVSSQSKTGTSVKGANKPGGAQGAAPTEQSSLFNLTTEAQPTTPAQAA